MKPSVFIEPSSALPLVTVTVTFRSGAAYDPVGKEGLARAVVRMLRRGTRTMSAEAVEETIDGLGASFGGYASVDTLSVQFEVIKRSLDAMVDVAAQLIAEPAFDEVELGRLVRQSKAALIDERDSDSSLAHRALRKALFEGHPYGRRIAGTLSSLDRLSSEDCRAFHRQHFTRHDAVVAVSGDVSREEAERLVERLLAGLPIGQKMPDLIGAPLERQGRHLVFVDKPERTQIQTLVGRLGTDMHDADHTALIVANAAFGGTFTSRLMQEVRAKRGWSYGAYSRLSGDRQRSSFVMSAAPAAADAAACLALELDLLTTWIRDGLTLEELEFIKRYVVRSHAFSVDTARKRVRQRMTNVLYDLPPDHHERYIERVEAVTLDEANAAVRHRLSAGNLVMTVVGTHAEVGEAIVAWIPELASTTVLPYDFE